MIKQIRLQGLSFKEELQGHKIEFDQSIKFLSLVPWEFCNWSCRYCHEDRRIQEQDELTLEEMKRIIQEAGELGIRSLLLLGGEVLLQATWPTVQAVVDEAFRQRLITLIYTNGSQLTEEMVDWLAIRDVSLAFKVDTLDPQFYDELTRHPGSYAATLRAIEMARRSPIGSVVCENNRERLVRLLFTTVGNARNVEEYVALARFATNRGARWMMESLNHRGDALFNPGLAIDSRVHSNAMRIAMALNPEQQHRFDEPCRLFSCVTVRKKGEIGNCPQDYGFMGNIRSLGSLKAACDLVAKRVAERSYRSSWTGACPIKEGHSVTA